jgi:hypothetical protein
MTRLPRILTLTFLLSGAFTAGLRSQEFTPRTTKVLDTDTTFVNGAAEPASTTGRRSRLQGFPDRWMVGTAA